MIFIDHKAPIFKAWKQALEGNHNISMKLDRLVYVQSEIEKLEQARAHLVKDIDEFIDFQIMNCEAPDRRTTPGEMTDGHGEHYYDRDVDRRKEDQNIWNRLAEWCSEIWGKAPPKKH